VKAPFIGLAPIPSLLIDRINVDFQIEVTDTNVNKSNSTAEATSSISGGWFCTKVNIAGKVSTSRENTRTTNQTAKYQVNVTATQQPPTEGLSKLMDIMASCIEPITNEVRALTMECTYRDIEYRVYKAPNLHIIRYYSPLNYYKNAAYGRGALAFFFPGFKLIKGPGFESTTQDVVNKLIKSESKEYFRGHIINSYPWKSRTGISLRKSGRVHNFHGEAPKINF